MTPKNLCKKVSIKHGVHNVSFRKASIKNSKEGFFLFELPALIVKDVLCFHLKAHNDGLQVEGTIFIRWKQILATPAREKVHSMHQQKIFVLTYHAKQTAPFFLFFRYFKN